MSTPPIAAAYRKRRPWRKLSGKPGTLWALIPQHAAELIYSAKYVRSLRCAICDFMEAIGHEPTPADFSAENIDALRRWHDARSTSRANNCNVVSRIKRLWLWCASKKLCPPPPPDLKPRGKPGNAKGHVWNPDADGNKVSLSDAEGTLWHICTAQYFPRNVRITKQTTRNQYEFALRHFKEFLGHDATVDDLTDDNCAGTMKRMMDKGLAAETINGSVGCVKALWTWLAKRRLTPDFPTFQNLKEPKRVPRAWSREELGRLIAACRAVAGNVAPLVLAADWWTALHLVIWDTSERIGAVLAIRKEWLNWQTGDLLIPAESRKGGERDMQYKLHPETLKALERITNSGSDLLFYWPRGRNDSLYYRYKRIRIAAGLPTDRKSAFHRVRRSVASHLHAAGHNATDALGHASADITRKSYLDPAIAGAVRPADVLFRPGVAAVVAVEVSPDAVRVDEVASMDWL
jgi:integrase